MADKRWKAAERRVAAMLGGTRFPVTGRGRGDQPDVLHPQLSIVVKRWSRLPAHVVEATAQAEAAALPGQMPIAIIHEVGAPYPRSLALIRLGDLLERLDTVHTAGQALGE